MLYKYFTQSSQQLYNKAVFYFTNTETRLKGLCILPKPKTLDTPQNILETRQKTSHEIVFGGEKKERNRVRLHLQILCHKTIQTWIAT